MGPAGLVRFGGPTQPAFRSSWAGGLLVRLWRTPAATAQGVSLAGRQPSAVGVVPPQAISKLTAEYAETAEGKYVSFNFSANPSLGRTLSAVSG